ncbi:ComF family protein [Modestobacter sp. I12A-02628]|uniref:ComF family protein n=1 Tax=Goekera deserti TaxID=2497753 RepID=UPI00141D23CD|nr:ComF family protein [Goekera deserti]MPQ99806.1 ComF family protein [Goekera deserti]NDI49963.1 ComF family protein [Goekera deserti]
MRDAAGPARWGVGALAAGWAALADLVLPVVCAGCAVPGAGLCGRCAALLARPLLAQPRRPPPGFPPTVAAGRYAGPVRPAVVAFKEHGRAELARPLGTALALAVAGVLGGVRGQGGVQGGVRGQGGGQGGVRGQGGGQGGVRGPGAGEHGDPRAVPVVLVPVPSTAAARRARGREHVRELAERAASELRAAGVDVAVRALVDRRGRSRDSAGLSAADRRANLRGSFVPARPGRPAAGQGLLVLVDDVVTSGATLAECSRVLTQEHGSPWPVLAAVVAATPRSSPRRPPFHGDVVITLREWE